MCGSDTLLRHIRLDSHRSLYDMKLILWLSWFNFLDALVWLVVTPQLPLGFENLMMQLAVNRHSAKAPSTLRSLRTNLQLVRCVSCREERYPRARAPSSCVLWGAQQPICSHASWSPSYAAYIMIQYIRLRSSRKLHIFIVAIVILTVCSRIKIQSI